MQVLRHVLQATGRGAPSRAIAGGLSDEEAVALVRPLLDPACWLAQGQLLTWFLALRGALWWAPPHRPGVVTGVLDGFDIAGFLAAASARGLLDLRSMPGDAAPSSGTTGALVGSALPAMGAMMDVPAELGGSGASGTASASAASLSLHVPAAGASPLIERLLSLTALGWAKQGADGVCAALLQGVVGAAPATYYAAAVGIACRHPVAGVRAAMLRTLSTVPHDAIPLAALAEAAFQLGVGLEAGWLESADVPLALIEQLFAADAVWEAVEAVQAGRMVGAMTAPCLTLDAATPAGGRGWALLVCVCTDMRHGLLGDV